MRHKWHVEIKHWADGGKIQNKTRTDSVYRDWVAYDEGEMPDFANSFLEWRIKPKTLRYRVALFNSSETGHFTSTIESPYRYDEKNGEYDPDLHKEFVKWLTDWIEVEI